MQCTPRAPLRVCKIGESGHTKMQVNRGGGPDKLQQYGGRLDLYHHYTRGLWLGCGWAPSDLCTPPSPRAQTC